MTFTPMHTVLKPGTSGNVRLETFKVSKEASSRTSLRVFTSGGLDSFVEAGTYCRLYVGSSLMMSDTPMEQRSNSGVVHKARGDVFIAGLGLGMVLVPILAKPEVKSVTVIEKYEDVVNLVGPHLKKLPDGKKLTIVHGDVFKWQPPKGQKWDVIYFDIWPNITEDNLDEMAKLHQKYKFRKNPDAWMSSWKRDELLWRRRQSRENTYGWR